MLSRLMLMFASGCDVRCDRKVSYLLTEPTFPLSHLRSVRFNASKLSAAHITSLPQSARRLSHHIRNQRHVPSVAHGLEAWCSRIVSVPQRLLCFSCR